MRPFTVHSGVAAPLLRANIDTDAIIPSREMRRVSKRGLGEALFADWRYLEARTRTPNPDFVLNDPRRLGASILLGGANFGCGSSREHAVWALLDFGIRAVVAPDFSPIFRKNCIANGLLPACVAPPRLRALARWSDADPAHRRLTVDLEATVVATRHRRVPFRISGAERRRLLRGLDAVALTQTRAGAIDAFERRRFAAHPWARLYAAEDS